MENEYPQFVKDLRQWVKENFENSMTAAARALDIPEGTFGSIYRGDRKSVEDIGCTTRKKIYARGVKSFYSPFFEPIDPEKDSGQVQLQKYIVAHYGGSIQKFAEKTGVHKGTIHGFLAGRTKRFKKNVRNIIAAKTRLPAFGGEWVTAYGEQQAPSAGSTMPQGAESPRGLVEAVLGIESELRGLTLSIAQNSPSYAGQLLKTYEPSLTERKQLVEAAIDVLVEQANYYRNATQDEREALVMHLRRLGEIERWGYTVNLLSAITQPGNTPDTFARSIEPPKKIKSNKT